MKTVKITYTAQVKSGNQNIEKVLTVEIPAADLEHFKERYGAEEVKASKKKETKDEKKQ